MSLAEAEEVIAVVEDLMARDFVAIPAHPLARIVGAERLAVGGEKREWFRLL